MDDADRAQIRIEQEIEARVRAARGIPSQKSVVCADCAEPLTQQRQEYGRCIHCAEAAERRAKTRRHP